MHRSERPHPSAQGAHGGDLVVHGGEALGRGLEQLLHQRFVGHLFQRHARAGGGIARALGGQRGVHGHQLAAVFNVGGGLGVDYEHPNRLSIPDFKSYFNTYAKKLKLRPRQTLHFELGRAVVAQCGSLITRTLFIKKGALKQFAIVDAGFTDLIRPALYQAYHKIENITSEEPLEAYDVVGPICESTDVFAKQIDLNKTQRGDLLAIRSAGAYGEIMASQYNCRKLPVGYMSDEI